MEHLQCNQQNHEYLVITHEKWPTLETLLEIIQREKKIVAISYRSIHNNNDVNRSVIAVFYQVFYIDLSLPRNYAKWRKCYYKKFGQTSNNFLKLGLHDKV